MLQLAQYNKVMGGVLEKVTDMCVCAEMYVLLEKMRFKA